MKKYTVVRQDWLESERGWGVRPDGHSLHLTKADLDAYIRAYWAGMPDEAPDEYSRPCGDPYLVDVDEATYALVAAGVHGIRRY